MKQSQVKDSPSPITECVIYVRVSSRKQLNEGDGLNGQEKRCRDYAERCGYMVLKVFYEEAVSGGEKEREAMEEMLAFLSDRNQPTIVIIDDLKRFSRDVEIHFALKVAIYKRGGRMESPGFHFEDTAESKFVETILAGAAELERNQNKRQVLNRMKSRLEAGYWTFQPMSGFFWHKDPVHKKVLVIKEAGKEIIREALEGFANNRFLTQTDVVNFLKSQGYFGTDLKQFNGKYMMVVSRMLRSPLYCGHLEYLEWGVTFRKAHHEGIISLETYQQIQDKLRGKPLAITRQDTSEDFILRGFVICSCCNQLLTASWSRGRNRRYAYYHCKNKGCEIYGKSIVKTDIEDGFIELIKNLEASDDVMVIVQGMAEDTWLQRVGEHRNQLGQGELNLKRIEQDIKSTSDNLSRSTNQHSFKVLENRLLELEAEREALEPKVARSHKARIDFGTAFEHVKSLVQNPYQTWNEGDLETKRLVVRLAFTSPLAYDREAGFGTADLALPYLVSARIKVSDSYLVDPTGIEPATSSVQTRRSTR